MPLFTYRCTVCDTVFETLVRGDEAVACSSCGSADLQRQIGAVAPDAKSPGLLRQARTAAAREGHFSHYARSERSRR